MEATNGNETLRSCSPEDKLSAENFAQQSYIHFVRDSVYAFAYALHNLHQNLCNGEPGVCEQMKHIDGPQIVAYLKNVTFPRKFSPCYLSVRK